MTAPRPDKCVWCRRRINYRERYPHPLSPTKDHVVPLVMGGRSFRWCCLACNQIKGDMSPFQWTRFMETVPNWWTLFPDGKYRGIRLYAHVVEGLTPARRT